MTGNCNAPEPGRLPVGLRFCQAYFAFAMLLALVFGFLCSPHMFDYDISMVRVLLLMAGVFMGDYDPTNAMLWSQWLFPFTAEGAAAVAIVVVLHPAAQWLLKKTGGRVWLAVLLSFLLNALVCTGIDFATGMIANQDYRPP